MRRAAPSSLCSAVSLQVRGASGFSAMPPLFEDSAQKTALFILKHKPEYSVKLDAYPGGFFSKTSLPAGNRDITLDCPNLRRKLNVFLCVCCSMLPIFPYCAPSSHRVFEGRFSISGGVGKQRHHQVRVAIDPGAAILIQPVLNVLFRHCLFHPPFWQGRSKGILAEVTEACSGAVNADQQRRQPT